MIILRQRISYLFYWSSFKSTLPNHNGSKLSTCFHTMFCLSLSINIWILPLKLLHKYVFKTPFSFLINYFICIPNVAPVPHHRVFPSSALPWASERVLPLVSCYPEASSLFRIRYILSQWGLTRELSVKYVPGLSNQPLALWLVG